MQHRVSGKKRSGIILRTSIISIITNVVLASVKFIIGSIARSISISNDAINNLSDALSSVITLIGTKLATKKPDKQHPLGHGRAEYMSSIIISIVVLYAGLTALFDSVRHIFHPEDVNYSMLSVMLVILGIIVKVVLGYYVRHVGKQTNSTALEDSGIDALLDAAVSVSVLLSIILNTVFHWNLEAWFGAVISLWIIKTGISMLRETISTILGKRFDSECVRSIHAICDSHPDVEGSYDLIIHDYGPEYAIGSVHISVPENMTAAEIDSLSREIQQEVYEKEHVVLSAIGIYSINETSEAIAEIRETIQRITEADSRILQLHGFYCDLTNHIIRFDIIVSFSVKNRSDVIKEVYNKLKALYPDYEIMITLDSDISD